MADTVKATVSGLLGDSKKAGRILALAIVLVIAGVLSVMLALEKPDEISDLVGKWLILLGSMVSFYFASTSRESKD